MLLFDDACRALQIGADAENSVGSATGEAYVFTRDEAKGGWTEIAKWNAVEAASRDFSGFDVAVSNGTIFVGAPGDDAAGTLTGTVYAFVPEPQAVLLHWAALAAVGLLRFRVRQADRGRRGLPG